VAVTSFQQSKQISSGEGGLVAGPARVIETVYRAADLGAFRLPGGMRDWDSEASVFADNLRMTELQAALIQDQAEMLSQTLTAQRSIRAALWKRLDGLPIIKSSTPEGDSGSHTLLLARDATAAAQFCQQLAASRVLARTVWKKTYLEYDLFRKWGIEEKIRPYPLPQRARLMSPRIVSVPSPKYLGSDASDQVAEAILDNAHLLAAGTDADE
jgi:dTDP-4-amino-4,6-dideoxygalactose transaminase